MHKEYIKGFEKGAKFGYNQALKEVTEWLKEMKVK